MQQTTLQRDLERIRNIEFYTLASTNMDQIIFLLKQWNLLQDNLKCTKIRCSRYGQFLGYQKDISRLDGGRYRCNGNCGTQVNLRENSIFSISRLSLPVLFRLIFIQFAKNKSTGKAAQNIPANESSVRRWFRLLRTAISEDQKEYYKLIPQLGIENSYELIEDLDEFKQEQQTQDDLVNQLNSYRLENSIQDQENYQSEQEDQQNLMIPDNVSMDSLSIQEDREGLKWLISPAVEIDESLFTHLTVDEEASKWQRQCWILGIYDRATKDIKLKAIGTDRSEQNIRILVLKYVATNKRNPTRVYTDKALFYNFLKYDGYRHFRINHTHGFGSGTWTTNHIESMWSQIKKLGQFDQGWNFRTIDQVQIALDATVWRWRHRNSDIPTELAQIMQGINFKEIEQINQRDEDSEEEL